MGNLLFTLEYVCFSVSHYPEDVFSDLAPLLFLQPCLWDALSSILVIQGRQNEEREGICEYRFLINSSRPRSIPV